MRRDNPNDSMIPEILRRLRDLETASPVGFTSVTRGALRVASNEGLLVEGSAKVSGWLVVTGTLKGTGTFDWSGDLILSGSQHVTGPTVFDGSLRVNGPIDVYGAWKLIGNGEIQGHAKVTGTWELVGDGQVQGNVVITGSVDVNSPGRIRITGGSSPATLEDGRLSFGTGGVVEADTTNGGVRLSVGTNRVYVGTGAVALQRGSISIILSGSGITMTGVPTISSADAGELPSGALWMSSLGQLFRVV